MHVYTTSILQYLKIQGLFEEVDRCPFIVFLPRLPIALNLMLQTKLSRRQDDDAVS